MARMTKEELARRKSEMTARARAEVAKTEIVQFRIDADNISKLYEHAARVKMPIGAMVRKWVMDRLEVEEKGEQTHLPQTYLDCLVSLQMRLNTVEEVLINEKVAESAVKARDSVRSRAAKEYLRVVS